MTRILIVDDSPTETLALKRMLEEHGYEAVTANSGELGLAIAKQDKPDLILMDVLMPGINGFQATRQLTRDPKTSNIPVIMVTTKDQETDRIWGLRQGAKEYIVKPPSESELLGKIQRLLEGHS